MGARTSSHASAPGTWVMIALTVAIVAYAMWSATRRTALVDDALAADARNASAVGGWPDMRIDINSANAAELALLPGLGERLAQRILDDREQHGQFKSVDDLERVPGLGAAMIERLRPYAVAE